MMAAAPALGALVVLAGCGPKGSGETKDKALGPARTVTFAVGTTGSDFVTDIALGCADAAAMLGWTFRLVLNAKATPDAHVTAIRQAVTARSDVIVTVDWYQAVIDEIAAGEKSGSHFAIVNSANNPDALGPLGVPFVGQEPRDNGRLMGERIAAALKDRGITTGSVLAGNPFPGSLNVEERIAGIRDGLASSPGLALVNFPDGSAGDQAASVGLYKAKIAALGNVVAHAAAGGEMSAVPLVKALEERGGDVQRRPIVGAWVSSRKLLGFVKEGQIDFALDENLYYQGMLAVQMAWSMLERAMPATTLSAGHAWATPETVDSLIASYTIRQQKAKSYGIA